MNTQSTRAAKSSLLPLLLLSFVILLACSRITAEEFNPEATYVGGDTVCAEYAEFLPTITQKSLFDPEVRGRAEQLKERAQNADPAIKLASEVFLRSLTAEGQMAVMPAMEQVRQACADAGYLP